MNEKITAIIKAATATALASTGPHGLNVIPISVVDVVDDEIRLYDFFMNKTAENIQTNPGVTLTSWQGFSGVQVRATAVYETAGEVYDAAVPAMKEQFPDRTLRAVIRLTPTTVYDVAPGTAGEQLWPLS